jgi:hypothetical protein
LVHPFARHLLHELAADVNCGHNVGSTVFIETRSHRTVQFYTEVLGFTVKARDRIERLGLGVSIDLVYLELGGTVVELISYDGAPVDPAPSTKFPPPTVTRAI